MRLGALPSGKGVLLAAMLVWSACSDDSFDADIRRDVVDTLSDSIDAGEPCDVEVSEQTDTGECILDLLYEKALFATDAERPDFGAFIALYRDNFCVGRVTDGAGRTDACFEMWWESIQCDNSTAEVRIYSPCLFHGKPLQEFNIRIRTSGELVDGLPTIEIDQHLFEVSGIARPSEIDAACSSYQCVSTWPGAPTSGAQ